MADRSPWLWIAGAGAALLALGVVFRKQLGAAMTAAEQSVFKLVMPSVAQPYADVIQQVAVEKNVSPFLITQLGYRESLWGTSSGLDQKGPGGRGDNGHGYGLMQIDDRSNADWIANEAWWDPYTNISKGVEIWLEKQKFFQVASPVSGLTDGFYVTLSSSQASRRGVAAGDYNDPRPLRGDDLNRAATASYNTGEGNVLMSLAAGVDPDVTTTGGNYSSDVLTRVASLLGKFQASQAVS